MKIVMRFLIGVSFIAISACGGGGGGGGDDPVVDEGPIDLGNTAFWHFDESSGAIAFNSSFDGLHGDITAAQRGNGKVNNALSYSANMPSYVEFPEAFMAEGGIDIIFETDQISIEAWVKFESLDPNLTYHFFGNADSGGIERFIYRIKDGQFLFLLIPQLNGNESNGDAIELIKTNFTFGVDTWYHVAFNYNGSEAKIYIDGVLNVQRPIVVNINRYVNRLYLGGSPNVRSFPGFIDELRFSADVRSEAEIQSYYDSTK